MFYPRYSRPVTALYVLLSPILALFASFMVLYDEVRELVVKDIPDFFRYDVVPSARWAIIEPLQAASVTALAATAAFRARLAAAFYTYTGNVRAAGKVFGYDVRWIYDEAAAFFGKGLKPSGFWLRYAIKDTGKSALRLLKTIAGR